MGQSWTLFNLDKLEYKEYGGGKLGEFFFDDAERFLVNILLSGQPIQHLWGGDRIILLGDCVDYLPPGVVLDTDSNILKEISTATSQNERVLDVCDLLYEKSSKVKARKVIATTDTLPDDTVYVLRNLDKKEYVRRDIVEKYRRYDEDVSSIPGLAQALYTLVGWSENSSAALTYNDKGYVPASGGTTVPLHRGYWAGNHIDVVTLTDELAKTFADEDWLDISEEKARHVSDVYACDGY